MSPDTNDFNPPPVPPPDEALKSLEAALKEAGGGTPGMWCFVPILVGLKHVPCGRPREKAQDLCCSEHWRLLPRRLRLLMVDANKHRSEAKRERASMLAADKAIDYLTGLQIQLPPVQRVVRDDGPRIIKPGGVERPGAAVSSDSKLIITPG